MLLAIALFWLALGWGLYDQEIYWSEVWKYLVPGVLAHLLIFLTRNPWDVVGLVLLILIDIVLVVKFLPSRR